MTPEEREAWYDRRAEYADSIAHYVTTNKNWELMTKEEAALAAVNVMMNDIGAAQGYMDAIGITVDLWEEPEPKINYATLLKHVMGDSYEGGTAYTHTITPTLGGPYITMKKIRWYHRAWWKIKGGWSGISE